jgi:pimeloyl-ACP methyl ester carboxylesterase
MPPPDSATELTADLGTDLTVHDWGGPRGAGLLFLMHGLTDSGECWPDAVSRWTAGYRVLSWDARGHGASPRFTAAERAAGAGTTMLRDAVSLLERLRSTGAEPPVVVGHSMGGGTAGSLAATRPDLVRAVVLEDPALADGGTPEERRRADGAARAADARRWHEDPEKTFAEERATNPGWPDAEYEPWARCKTQTDIAMLETGDLLVHGEPLEVLARVAVPTLIVTAGEEYLWDEAKRAAVRVLGNRHLEIACIPGSGHCVRRSAPEAFHALVDPWIADHA